MTEESFVETVKIVVASKGLALVSVLGFHIHT